MNIPSYNSLVNPTPAASPLAGQFVGSGGTTTGGGFTQPDWSGLLAQYMSPYESMNSANLAALQAQIDAQSRLASSRFQGSDTSTLARLSDTHNQNVLNITHALAARGLIDSGDRPFQINREALGYKRATTDASNQLLDYLTGLQQSYADAQRQGLFGLQTQRLNLASTLGQLYQPTYTEPTYTSNLSKISGGQYGQTAAPTSTTPTFSNIYGKYGA